MITSLELAYEEDEYVVTCRFKTDVELKRFLSTVTLNDEKEVNYDRWIQIEHR